MKLRGVNRDKNEREKHCLGEEEGYFLSHVSQNVSFRM